MKKQIHLHPRWLEGDYIFSKYIFWVNYSFKWFDTLGICSLGALVPAGLWVRRSVSRGGWGRDGCWKSHGWRFPNHPDVSTQWVCGKRLLGWTGLLECLMNYTFKNNGSLLALLRTFNTYGNFPLHKRFLVVEKRRWLKMFFAVREKWFF